MKLRIEGKEFRVYGPPGTGKTTWITKVARRAVDKFGEDQVSLCSLTNAAIREVVGRDLPVSKDNVSTLHSRCKRSLSAPEPAESKIKEFIKKYPEYSTAGGYNPCLPAGLAKRSCSGDDGDTDEVLLSGGGVSLYERAQILRQQMIPKEEWPMEVRRWYSVWDSWCRESGHLDFTGWLEAALEIRPLPAQQIIFVDEAQDHTPLQLAVIRSWDARIRVLVGDDDQNLYEWSGAIPKGFYGVDLPSEREKILHQSYRIPRAVHRMAMRWVKRIRDRKEKDYLPRDAEGSVKHLDYTLDDAKYNGSIPQGLLKDKDQTYMILTSCAYMLDSLIDVLKKNRIPFHNPYRKSNLRWNPLANPSDRIRDYMAASQDPEGEWTGAQAHNWASILKSTGVFKTGKKEAFLNLCEQMGGKKISNETIRQYFNPDVAELLGEKDISVLRSLRKIGVSGSWDYALDVMSDSRGEFEPKVIIGTIHSVKGGEADNVYLFPDLSPSGYLDYTGSNPDRIFRLFYVGITRARENLILCQQSRPKAVDW